MNKPSLHQILNFLQFPNGVATAGQPTAEQFLQLRDAGYQVVINLAPPTASNALPNERAIVESCGMTYLPIPIVWEQPTLEGLEQFFQTMQTYSNRVVFVHCAKNMRVSVFMFLYRVLCEGIQEAAAQQDLNRIWQPNETWQQFIQQAIQHYRERISGLGEL